MKNWKWGLLPLLLLASRSPAQTPPQLSVQLSNGFAHLSITGEVGSGCTIQSVTNLSRNWQFVTKLTLPSNPFLFVDAAGTSAGQIFYRVYAQQVPTNIVATNLVWISPGTFTMGSPDSEAERDSDEGPQIPVTISQGFWMGRYQVTQGEYLAVMGFNPSWFNGIRNYVYVPSCGCFIDVDYTDLNRPVESVSWNDATVYCSALTTKEQTAGRLPVGYVYRLPKEAEWEYACRAGTTTAFYYGPDLRSGMANFNGQYEYGASTGTTSNPTGAWLAWTTPVGRYAPNAWGLYDMHGNVFEWCRDWYGAYPGGSVTDPQGPASGSYRVLRGGDWYDNAWFCRSAFRFYSNPDYRHYVIGFRVVLAPGQP